MAAGQGFKTFTTGEVLSASDVNGYLMQGVLVFASAAARDAAITSPQEGQFAYLKDTNVTTYYTGSAWANLDTTGMTNPMTTTGDTIYSSSGSTPARLGIGSTGQVLTVSGGLPAWSSPASGGGFTLIATATPSAASTFSFTSIPTTTYKHLMIVANELVWSATGNAIKMRFATGSYYSSRVMYMTSTPTYSCDAGGRGDTYFGQSQNEGCPIVKGYTASGTFGDISSKSVIWIYDMQNTTQDRLVEWRSFGQAIAAVGQGVYENSAALDTIEFATTAGTVTGTVKLYGVN